MQKKKFSIVLDFYRIFVSLKSLRLDFFEKSVRLVFTSDLKLIIIITNII